MDTDAVHLWLDELHGELCSRDQVHLVLPQERRLVTCQPLPLQPLQSLCPPASSAYAWQPHLCSLPLIPWHKP